MSSASKTLGGFTLDEVLLRAKIAHRYSNLEENAASSEMHMLSLLEMYKLKKQQYKEESLRINELNITFIFNSQQIIVYIPGMNLDDVEHYKIVLNAILIPCDLIKGRVHIGFYKMFLKIRSSIREKIMNICKAYNVSSHEMNIDIMGHSMGGAISYLLGLSLKQDNFASQIRVLTFGAPRVFSPIAAHEYDKFMLECTLRITHGYRDIVTGLAPAFAGYSHIGRHLIVSCENAGRNISDRHAMCGYLFGVNTLSYDEEEFKEKKIGRMISICSNLFRWGQELSIGTLQTVIVRMRNKLRKSSS